MNRFAKWGFAVLFLVLVGWYGFTYTVRESSVSLLSRFGRIMEVNDSAGLYMKLPWPIDGVYNYDVRRQFLNSGLTETLTRDKKNVILQTYMVWSIDDPVRFHTRIGSMAMGESYLFDLLANAKNGVMGNYNLSALVSTNADDIKIDEIEKEIIAMTAPLALENYGIAIQAIQIQRLALPAANIESVFQQMRADRQKSVSQLLSEGERDASILKSKADAEAAQIIADGRAEAAAIDADTEKQSSQIYAQAYTKNPELFTMLKRLMALESSVSKDTVMVMSTEESPFSILLNTQE